MIEGTEESVLHQHQQYATPDLAGMLEGFHGKISYDYDWRINEP
jgi:hypothetical protein